MRTIFWLITNVAIGGSVLTGQYGNSRVNANTSEVLLTPSNVSKLVNHGSWSVDGMVYGQVLYSDGAPPLLIAATDNGTVYAFNANTPGSSPIWSVHLGTPKTTNDPNFLGGKLGCTATPVIDQSAGVVYVVCVNSSDAWKLYALSLSDGSTFHAAVTIAGTSNGLTFDGSQEQCRTALTLANGNIYFGFASYADSGPWQGWAFAYNATTLAQVGVLAVVNGSTKNGGIWMSGGGFSVDGSGNVYFITGNGIYDGTNNWGQSLLKCSSTLSILDHLTPSDWATLNASDLDFGSGRAMIVGSQVWAGGKQGTWWVTNQSSLGGVQDPNSPTIPQVFQAAGGDFIFSGTAFANNHLYTVDVQGTIMQSFSYGGTTFNTTAVASIFGIPLWSAGMAYSSNGASSGLVWVAAASANETEALQDGYLEAFDAITLSRLYVSPVFGKLAKYTSPTVVNGHVFVGTFSNTVVSFGLSSHAIGGTGSLGGTMVIQ